MGSSSFLTRRSTVSGGWSGSVCARMDFMSDCRVNALRDMLLDWAASAETTEGRKEGRTRGLVGASWWLPVG